MILFSAGPFVSDFFFFQILVLLVSFEFLLFFLFKPAQTTLFLEAKIIAMDKALEDLWVTFIVELASL